MRKLKIITLIILLIGALIIYNPKEIMYQAGSYEGIGEGHHGPIKVQITTDEYEIKEIKIIEEQEIPVLADIVYEKIPGKIIKKNSVKVDVIAGATLTSDGLIEAVNDALSKARIKED